MRTSGYSIFHQSSQHGYDAVQGHGRHGRVRWEDALQQDAGGILQYIIPIAYLIGAALSVLARRKRGELFAHAAMQPAQQGAAALAHQLNTKIKAHNAPVSPYFNRCSIDIW